MLDFKGVDEVPKVFIPKQVEYLNALIVHHAAYLDSQLANIIDACNLPSKQRKAVKSLMRNALVDYNCDFKDDIELVKTDISEAQEMCFSDSKELITHVKVRCPYCAEFFKSMVIITETVDQEGLTHKPLSTEECPHCGATAKVTGCFIAFSAEVKLEQINIEEGVN